MITEDYVSFETAKLLKEKGFDWECIGYYVDDEPNDVKYSFLGETNSTWESRCCSAPTLQMAMKWLREEHNRFIEISTDKAPNFKDIIFRPAIYDKEIGCLWESDNFPTYEQACDAAIKYCLENLI